jgi:hypothetical protein
MNSILQIIPFLYDRTGKYKTARRGLNEAHGKVEYVFRNNTFKGFRFEYFANSKAPGHFQEHSIPVHRFKPG